VRTPPQPVPREGGGLRPPVTIAAADLPDNGAVLAWLGAHGADAVLVRPDHCVFGTGKEADLIAARDALLGTKQEITV
ncbi:MAG: hypothetical protein ACKOVA_11505, partial [Novosphingobium sp.]